MPVSGYLHSQSGCHSALKSSVRSIALRSKFDRSNEVSNEQPENIYSNESTFEVSKDLRLRFRSDEQPWNIASMLFTFEVSKFDTFSEASDEQPENIEAMLFTFEVLKFDTFSEASDEQPENIASIPIQSKSPVSSPTFEVSKELRSMLFKDAVSYTHLTLPTK